MIRHGHLGGSNDQPVVKTPINAIPDNVDPKRELVASNTVAGVAPPASSPVDGLTSGNAVTGNAPITGSSKDDKDLELTVREKSDFGDNLVSLVTDPRTQTVFLTYMVGPKDNERIIGTNLAKTLFDTTSDPETVTIRAMRFEKLLFMADVPRDRYNETLTEDWKKKAANEMAWVDYVITNEWPEKSGKVTPPPPGPEGDNPPAASSPPTAAPRKGDVNSSNGEAKEEGKQ